MQVLSKRQIVGKSLRPSRQFARLDNICKDTRICQRHNQKRCGVVTPHQIYPFGRKWPIFPRMAGINRKWFVELFSAQLMPRPFYALRAPRKESGSADASPYTRASRALEENRLGLRLALFARFARLRRKAARLAPRPFRALRALWKGIGSARASPFSRASRALKGNRLGWCLA